MTETLTTYPQLVQGSQDWLDARAGIVTASTIGKLLTPQLKPADNETSRGLINTLAAERITGDVEYVWPNADMQRGTEQEPVARQYYVDNYAPVAELGFMKRRFDGFDIGFSPDGLVGVSGVIEIKSRRAKIQLTTIIDDHVPTANLAQIHCGLLVADRAWCHYVSFTPGLPLYTKRIVRSAEWDAALIEAARVAEERIQEVIERYEASVVGLPVTDPMPDFGVVELKL